MIWVLVVFLVLALVASTVLNVHTIKKNMELNDQRESLVDTIEESLDQLDECYMRIARNAEIPVFSDEPVVREVLSDMRKARNAVLTIASRVVIYGEDKEGERRDE